MKLSFDLDMNNCAPITTSSLVNRLQIAMKIPDIQTFTLGTYPELPHRVDMLRLQQGVIIAIHQTLPMHHCGIVHQDSDVSYLS